MKSRTGGCGAQAASRRHPRRRRGRVVTIYLALQRPCSSSPIGGFQGLKIIGRLSLKPPFRFDFTLRKMIFLAWSSRPSHQEQTACVKSTGFKFNYDDKFRGRTAKSSSNLQQDQELSDGGFVVNHARTLVGSGVETFEKGKSALQTWRHFTLNWAFVDPQTPIQKGSNFCVCFKALFPWVLMPLQVAYVDESKNINGNVASFGFGSGTLQGHMLAGEERFSVSMDEKSNVWYEILSFSKPANFLSFICYPYVLLMQKHFARRSSLLMQNHLSEKLK